MILISRPIDTTQTWYKIEKANIYQIKHISKHIAINNFKLQMAIFWVVAYEMSDSGKSRFNKTL